MSIEQVQIGTLLDEIESTFRSVEARLVVTKLDGVWTLVAGVLAAQYATVEAVRQRHQRILDKQGPLARDNFELLLKALPAGTLRILLDGIDKGRWMWLEEH